MANKSLLMLMPVDKDLFIEAVHARGSSIRKLGNTVGRTEKTIRRYLDRGEMPYALICAIANQLNYDPEYLYGN